MSNNAAERAIGVHLVLGGHQIRFAKISVGGRRVTLTPRMLRTALSPAIAAWLEDPSVIEVMLNPDGRIWIDNLAETGECLAWISQSRRTPSW
jgi:Flp pilus assembly CpaF family ATPase